MKNFLVLTLILWSFALTAQIIAQTTDGSTLVMQIQRRDTSEIVKRQTGTKRTATLRYSEYEYFIAVSLGTPAQLFKCSFNFELGDSWISHKSCDSCGDSKSKFNETKSSSFSKGSKSVNIKTSGGSQINGTTGYDTVSINGLKVTKQGFILVKNQSGRILDFMIDGQIGLGFASQSFSKLPTFLDNAYSQKLIPTKTFGLWLNSNISANNSGEIMFGGYNSARYTGKSAWTKITKTDTWQFKIDSISVAGKSITVGQNSQALLQPINIFIKGPVSQVTSLMNAVGATLGSNQFYQVNCTTVSSLPNIIFKINGVSLSLSPKAYVLNDNNVCIVLFAGEGNSWVLGNPFNRGIYTMYDLSVKKIGFAVSK